MSVASRYAKSLLDLSVQTKQLEEVRSDMRLIADVCKHNHEFVLLLESPVIKTDKKMSVLKQIFSDKISQTSIAFLNLIAVKRRESYIDDIAFAFEDQYKEHKNITSAVITTAVPLDSDTKSKILDLIKKSVTGEVDLVEKVDKSLIGGFVLTVNDKQVDISIRRKLNDYKKNFSGNLYIPELN